MVFDEGHKAKNIKAEKDETKCVCPPVRPFLSQPIHCRLVRLRLLLSLPISIHRPRSGWSTKTSSKTALVVQELQTTLAKARVSYVSGALGCVAFVWR